MTIIHKGIRRLTTDVLADYGQAFYAQNWRYKRMGEIGRRPGLGKSNMAQLAGPVRAMICGNLYFPYLVQITGGDVSATLEPEAHWNDPVMHIPDGEVGQPSAPTIDSITALPASPQTYVAGVVTFTPTITYDGMSGALIYAWVQTVGPAAPFLPFGTASVYSTDFNFSCIPGLYSFTLTVTTTLNGFTTGPVGFDFTVNP